MHIHRFGKITTRFLLLSFCLSMMMNFVKSNEDDTTLTISDKLHYGPRATALPGSYIIAFVPGTATETINQIMEEFSDGFDSYQVLNSFSNALLAKSIYINITDVVDDTEGVDVGDIVVARAMIAEKFQLLLNSIDVDFIEEEQIFKTNLDQESPPSWGLDSLDSGGMDNNYQYEYTGEGVKAYIIDTGIHSTHNDFGGRVTCGYNAITQEDCEDYAGHGTHVAGIVGGNQYGVAKAVDLITIKVLDGAGTGSTSGVIAGVDWLVAQAMSTDGPHVANMSLGGFFSTALNRAVEEAIRVGVFVVAAAGNLDEDACNTSPAVLDIAITVASIDEDYSRSWFSNWGECVDVFAPGKDIISAGINNNFATSTQSGTSMAAPHVAGIAAMYYEEFPDAQPQQILAQIIEDAVVGAVSDTKDSPNVLAAVATSLSSLSSPTTPPDDDSSQSVSPGGLTVAIAAVFLSFLGIVIG